MGLTEVIPTKAGLPTYLNCHTNLMKAIMSFKITFSIKKIPLNRIIVHYIQNICMYMSGKVKAYNELSNAFLKKERCLNLQ